MAEQGTVPAAEDRRDAAAVLRESRVPNGINAVMDLMEPGTRGFA